MLTKQQLASVIDHTLLRPEATLEQIDTLCRQAVEYGFYSVCVNPARAAYARRLLEDSSTLVLSVIGFPFGAETTTQKVLAAREMDAFDIDGLDMVVDLGAVKGGAFDFVGKEIASVRSAFPDGELKVILETCLLTDDEKIAVCQAAKAAGADFVKTSTGFSAAGATEYDVMLLKKHAEGLKVKASGGIRTLEDCAAMLAAGADRIGTSSGVEILDGMR